MIFVPIGTKAQLIKMAPVIQELRHQQLPFKFILTGQHKETIDELYQAFQLPQPDDHFIEPNEADSYKKLATWLIKSSWNALFKLKKQSDQDCILVHGDTLSTLQCALLGRIKNIPVIHIEAGLRSFNIFNPFPEEIIRRLVTALSSYFIVQDDAAEKNLSHKQAGKILNTQSNTMLDALAFANHRITEGYISETPNEKFAIASLHRNENLNNHERFQILMTTVLKAQQKTQVLFILHPVTKAKLQNTNWLKKLEDAGVQLLNRMDYLAFTKLMLNAEFLITDGGSNQEEASYIGIPCMIMRDFSERQEGLGGNALLSLFDPKKIDYFLNNYQEFRKPAVRFESESSKKIITFIKKVIIDSRTD